MKAIHSPPRPGVMVAAYRIALEHEKVADAISEMHCFHFDGFWHPHLARYVRSLPIRLQSEAAFKSLSSVQRSGTLSQKDHQPE